MQLYIFYLGGSAPHSNIELHDVQFVAAEHPEQAYPVLRERWFGDPKLLHIDGYAPVEWVDGYQIVLKQEPYQGTEQLYFVNLGGYRANELAECHQFGLFVTACADEAKQKAKEKLLPEVLLQHKDDLFLVDNCLHLSESDGYFIHLVPQEKGIPYYEKILHQGYFPIPQ